MTCLVIDTDDKASVADNAAFDIPAGTDFLFEMWLKQNSTTGSFPFIAGKDAHYFSGLGAGSSPFFTFYHSVDGSNMLNASGNLTNSVWTHFMFVYDYSAGAAALFIDGTRDAYVTGFSVSGGISDNGSAEFKIGDSTFDAWDGKICEIYGSTDITGYEPSNTTITVPTAARTSDGNTVFLYHCDEGTGTTIDNAEGTSAIDLAFAAATNDPSWDTNDTPFVVAGDTSFFLQKQTLPTYILAR